MTPAIQGSWLHHASAVELGNSTQVNVNQHCTPVAGAVPDVHGPPIWEGPPVVLFISILIFALLRGTLLLVLQMQSSRLGFPDMSVVDTNTLLGHLYRNGRLWPSDVK